MDEVVTDVQFPNTNVKNNPEQKIAVENIIKRYSACQPLCSTPYVVHGPPGTGKSTTLLEVIYQMIKILPMNMKILVSAPSNAAVDLLATAVVKAGLTNILHWYGLLRDVEQVPDDLKPHSNISDAGTLREPSYDILDRVDIVFSTLSTASKIMNSDYKVMEKKRQKTTWFSKQLVFQDTLKAIIVDEAGQATEPETLAAITDSDAFVVLAGDHCQLGPTVMSPKAEHQDLESAS